MGIRRKAIDVAPMDLDLFDKGLGYEERLPVKESLTLGMVLFGESCLQILN